MLITGCRIHAELRQKTRDFHIAVETKLGVLLSDELSLDQYAGALKRFYGFYKPIESRLGCIPGLNLPELKLVDRIKLPWLVRDLAALSVDSAELANLPCCDNLPRLETVSEALGCLYVLEGSTLGGKVITGHVKRVLPLDERRGCSFFNSYGDEVGRMWRFFLERLAEHCEDDCDDDVVVHSARQTFASLDRWFSNVA